MVSQLWIQALTHIKDLPNPENETYLKIILEKITETNKIFRECVTPTMVLDILKNSKHTLNFGAVKEFLQNEIEE